MTSPLILTFDVDWAPDFVIDALRMRLSEARIKATFFITHASPAIDRLRRQAGLFELGVHPNFGHGSTHGQTPAEVIGHCMTLVPEARMMRTHGLVQSTNMLQMVADQSPIEIDASVYWPGAYGEVCDYPLATRTLKRVIYGWEDDFEMYRPHPQWSADRFVRRGSAMIVAMHPIHVFLNAPTMTPYFELRRRCPNLLKAGPDDVMGLVMAGGAGDFLESCISVLGSGGGQWLSAYVAQSVQAADQT